MREGNGIKLRINEVATRDGLQNEAVFVDTDDKVRLVDQLSGLGYSKIEVTSFTSPTAIPALKDAEAVMHRIQRAPGVVYTALIPNVRGGERALECKVDEFNLVMSASETHNLANLRMTRPQSLRQLGDVAALALAAKVPVNVSLSCVFGCPMEGEVPQTDVLDLVGKFVELGATGVTLCDTTGMAYPTQVFHICESVAKAYPQLNITGHFHNTRGMGLVNTLAAVEAGIRQFDMSLGGIGGCPYAPGASGNVATEDVVHMLQWMGYDTGVSVPGLISAAHELERLVGHELPAQVSRAGERLMRHAPPVGFEEIQAHAFARDMNSEK